LIVFPFRCTVLARDIRKKPLHPPKILGEEKS
jgi:hypothetical protein